MVNCNKDLPVEPGNKEGVKEMMIASKVKTPYPEDDRRSMVIPKISWGSSQECVGKKRHVGDQSGWSQVTSALRNASKRML